MGASDFKITSDVRRILTKKWINTKKLRFSSVGGVIYLRGDLDVLYNAPNRDSESAGMTGTQVGDLERALRRVPNVKRVSFQLNNWEKRAEGWRRKIL